MPRQAEDLIGRRFGRLVVLERHGSCQYGPTWLCKCDCGNTKIAAGALMKRGSTMSCGCIAEELRKKNFTGAHRTHGGSGSRLYIVWQDMLNRCYRENVRPYKWYGAKGIKVCDDWHDFVKFRDWAYSTGYDDAAERGKCTIDRINPYGDYEPSNCRWVDMKTQANNKRRHHERPADNVR